LTRQPVYHADAMFNLALLLQRTNQCKLLAALSRQRLSIRLGHTGPSIIEIL